MDAAFSRDCRDNYLRFDDASHKRTSYFAWCHIIHVIRRGSYPSYYSVLSGMTLGSSNKESTLSFRLTSGRYNLPSSVSLWHPISDKSCHFDTWLLGWMPFINSAAGCVARTDIPLSAVWELARSFATLLYARKTLRLGVMLARRPLSLVKQRRGE